MNQKSLSKIWLLILQSHSLDQVMENLRLNSLFGRQTQMFDFLWLYEDWSDETAMWISIFLRLMFKAERKMQVLVAFMWDWSKSIPLRCSFLSSSGTLHCLTCEQACCSLLRHNSELLLILGSQKIPYRVLDWLWGFGGGGGWFEDMSQLILFRKSS